MSILYKIKKTFPNFALFTLALELEYLLKDCETVLDLGCGKDSPLGLIKKKKFTVGVDAFNKSITESKKNKIHDKYYLMDILNIKNKFHKSSFDAVIAMDVIEHLKKKDGVKLIKLMEEIAKKKIVILTPNGFIGQEDIENNLFQEHLSGWGIGDFEKRNFKVFGKYGPKILRGQKASLKWKPKIIWGILSELAHFLYTKRHPEKSFSLLCYKSLKK